MGSREVRVGVKGDERRLFMRQVLNDLVGLDQIMDRGLIETDVRRVGAEQEVFLVDRSWKPACVALELLEELNDPYFATELGQFNLEMNLDPLVFGGDCLRRMERQLNELVGKLRTVAGNREIEVALTGILPTFRKSDLVLENMTPHARYAALNRAMTDLRGGTYELYIKGVDELILKHDSVMLEACNASFQVHFQTGAEEFPHLYNIAQLVAAPVLAAAVNSPLLFGRQLWSETRIALFQQSVDTRNSLDFVRERSPRVTFGRDWVRNSVLELFREDVSRFRALVIDDLENDSLAELESGEIPKLRALCLYNSTVYRWNRACYGISEGKPHLRIENRVLPSGPTTVDEIANAAFWFGLITRLSTEYEDITGLIPFEDAKLNFRTAGRLGLGAQLRWLDGETHPADKLICERLLPMSRDGLASRGIDAVDIDRYLGVIEQRVSRGRTGSQWMVRSLAGMQGRGNIYERLSALTAALVGRQKEGHPVGEWEPARLEEAAVWRDNFLTVEQFMTTDLFTVNADESLDLVANLMDWNQVRHIPVEDHEHRLIGLVSYRCLIKLVANRLLTKGEKPVAVSDVMKRDLVTIAPDLSTLEAIGLMRKHKISCLPVVKGERLVGILTERDLVNLAAELIQKQLG